jgi:hypothetical protein
MQRGTGRTGGAFDLRQSWSTAELRGGAWREAHSRMLRGLVPPLAWRALRRLLPLSAFICVHLRFQSFLAGWRGAGFGRQSGSE